MSALRRAARAIALDIGPLKTSRDFRYLFFGQVLSTTGSQFTRVAMFIQVQQLTGSPAAVGTIGLVMVIPLLAVSVIGGVILDRVDRRRMLIRLTAAQAAVSATLAAITFVDRPALWAIYSLAALGSACSGLELMTRAATIPNLVRPEEFSQANALGQLSWNTAAIAGPALGGILVATVGAQWAYAIDAVSFGAVFAAAMAMSPQPPQRDLTAKAASSGADDGETRRRPVLADVREGLSFLKTMPVLQLTFVLDLIAMIFGMPAALFPVLAVQQFHAGPAVAGFMFSSVAVGGVIAAATSGWVGGIVRHGRAVVVAICAWGAAIAAFGLVGDRLWLALVLLAMAGASDIVSAVFRSTMLAQLTPDGLRGRMASVHILVVRGGPFLGDFEAGLVAQWFTPTISVVAGGVLCIVGALTASAAVPAFWRYRAEPPEQRVEDAVEA